MANIHINRNGTSLGVFPEEEVRAGLSAARFLPTDLAWREGMATWLPLAQFPEFASEPVTATNAAAGAVPMPAVQVPPSVLLGARSGLPWDRRNEIGLVSAFVETMKLVLLNPTSAFTMMKTEGGLGGPFLYALIGGSFGVIIYLLFSALLSSFGVMHNRDVFGAAFAAGFGILGMIIFVPFGLAIGLFVGAAVLHLCLMVVGGAKRSFEATFRGVCFTAGSTQPLVIVPVCGGMAASIWSIVCNIIGLARAHETETGRAALAVFLPLIVCCGGGILLAMMFGLLGALTGAHH